jgi:hypothetical protein
VRALFVLAVFVLFSDPASAGGGRDCASFADSTVTATDLGCFETLRWKDDYVYGTRVCLIRSAANVCSGVFFELGGPPRFEAKILDHVSCPVTGNRVTFKSISADWDMSGHVSHTPLSFHGVLDNDRLRGTYSFGEEATKVNWKRTRKSFHTRSLVGAACKRRRPRPSRDRTKDALAEPL